MQKLKDIVEKLTPKLERALAGPLQGQAMTMLLKHLKVTTEEEAVSKLESDPEAVKQLKNAESDFVALVEAPAKTKKSNDLPLIIITIIYNIGYFALLGFFLYYTIGGGLVLDEWVKGTIGTLIGVLTAQLPTINGYWFGSSAGSAKKTEAMNQQISKG